MNFKYFLVTGFFALVSISSSAFAGSATNYICTLQKLNLATTKTEFMTGVNLSGAQLASLQQLAVSDQQELRVGSVDGKAYSIGLRKDRILLIIRSGGKANEVSGSDLSTTYSETNINSVGEPVQTSLACLSQAQE